MDGVLIHSLFNLILGIQSIIMVTEIHGGNHLQERHSLDMMGTRIDLMIEAENAKELMKEACYLLEVYKNRFSANDEDSELVRVNQMAGISPVKVHPELFELISVGKFHSLQHPSNLNIAIGPLVQSWRIGFDDARVPDDMTIQAVVALTNPQNILLDEAQQSIFLTEKGMKIDLGALAKGYIADKIMTYLKNKQVISAMINLGGNVLVYGVNPKRESGEWLVGIQHPQKKRGNNLGILRVKNKSVVTSGIYERHLKVGDKDYHHIFDRRTGYPIETEMASLTIVADKSVDCEIWTTRLFGLPLLESLATIQKTPDIEGIVITQDNRIAVTDGLKQDFQLLYS